MATAEKVVVVMPVEYLHNQKTNMVAVRIPGLGLTAYGDKTEDAVRKVKLMFGTYVELHRKYGTLEKRLNRSGLMWCPANKYEGSKPVEVVTADGSVEYIKPKTQQNALPAWQETKELVMAY